MSERLGYGAPEGVRVVCIDQETEFHGLFATRPYKKGEKVFEFKGIKVPTSEANAYALQINNGVSLESFDDKIFDNFLNHQCLPNCRVVIKGKKVLLEAITDIMPGDEFGFHYCSTENKFRGQGSFMCTCGSPHCLGPVEGFSYLQRRQQREIFHLLLPYLRAKFLLNRNHPKREPRTQLKKRRS